MPVLRIPFTVNGKVDREALIHVWSALTGREREVVPPADKLEAGLVDIYARVLEARQVSVLDTFLDLGGNSLLSFRLLDVCHAELRVQPEVGELLGGTIRDVARSIRARTAPEAR